MNDPGRRKADQVEGAIGEMSSFHMTKGVYAEGVHTDVATLPEGWRDRLVTWNLESSHPARPHFLEPHDLAVAKLAAHRGKDRDFVDALLRQGLLDIEVLRERADLLEDGRIRTLVRGWLDHYPPSGRRPLSPSPTLGRR